MQAHADPLDTLWQAPAIMWVLVVCEGLSAVLTLSPGIREDLWIHFLLASLVTQWVAFMTLGGLYAGRRWLALQAPVRVAQVALGLLLVNTWAICALAWWQLDEVWALSGSDWWALALRLTAIAITVGLLGLAAFQNHWRTRQLAVQAKQSELEALQARIRPHFLFNTLNIGAALVHQRPEAAEQLLLDLADLFRAALAGPREIPLQEELALARRYLEIEALRFGDRLQVEWDLPEQVPAVTVPTLTIQPLVENAIRHGVEPSRTGGKIGIRVSQEDGTLCVRVRNSLPTGAAAVTPGHRVGLRSARARIQALTQGRGTVETSIEGDTYVSMLTIPGVEAN